MAALPSFTSPQKSQHMAYANKIISHPKTGQEIRFVRTAKDTAGQVLEMESRFQPHSKEPVPHYHPVQTEHFTALSGAIRVRLADTILTLEEGDTLCIPPNTVHSMWNPFDQKAVVRWWVEPALRTEHFLETGMGLARDGKTNEAGMPPLLQVALMANKYAGEFRLAKPPFWLQRVLFTLLSPLARLKGYRATYTEYLD
jgi:quercetin dioxygenase-like cupin family protein